MSAAPGWYADPSNPAQVRWWDGATWSAHSQPVAPPPPGYGAPYPPASYSVGTASRPVSAARGNTFSFITMGVVALYIVLAFSAHIVVFGILPVLMSVRAVRAKERLAWVAVGCAVVAVLVALAALAH